MKRFRVAHVITRLCRGGAQENTFHTVRRADRDRFDVDLISGPTDGAEGSLEPDIAAAGIDIKRIPTLTRSPSPLNDYRAYRDLLALFRRERYDIVHTHTSKAGYVARLAAKRAGVPIIVHTPHGHIFFGYYASLITKFFIALEQHAAKHTDLLIALTQTGLEDHLARGIGRREQWRVIGSGIDLSPFETARTRRGEIRASLGVNGKSALIGYVGRLEPVKGVAYFVEAARAVAERNPHARFVVVGDGAEREALERAAAPMGDRMTFLGLRNDVPDLMSALDVLVLPSLNEGMGRVLVEAAAAGTPVVASNVGGVPDIVRDGETGVLVAPGDAQAIANAALSLVDKREHYGETARTAVAPRFCLNAMVADIEAQYARLMKEKHLDA